MQKIGILYRRIEIAVITIDVRTVLRYERAFPRVEILTTKGRGVFNNRGMAALQKGREGT